MIVVARTNKVSQSVRANDGATWTGLLGALYKTATERNTGQGFIVNEILEMSSDYMLGIKQHNLSPYLQFIQSLLLLLDVSLWLEDEDEEEEVVTMELSFCNFTPLGIPVRCRHSP